MVDCELAVVCLRGRDRRHLHPTHPAQVQLTTYIFRSMHELLLYEPRR